MCVCVCGLMEGKAWGLQTMVAVPSGDDDNMIVMQQPGPNKDQAAFYPTSLLSILHCPNPSDLAHKPVVDSNSPKERNNPTEGTAGTGIPFASAQF